MPYSTEEPTRMPKKKKALDKVRWRRSTLEFFFQEIFYNFLAVKTLSQGAAQRLINVPENRNYLPNLGPLLTFARIIFEYFGVKKSVL